MSQFKSPNNSQSNKPQNRTLTTNMNMNTGGHYENENQTSDRSSNRDLTQEELNSEMLNFIKNCKLNSSLQTVENLLQQGVSPNLQDSEGVSLLMQVARKGHRELTELLLENHANLKLRDKYGRTALFHAVEANPENPDMILTLLEHGADPNAEADDRCTPLLKAVEKEYLKATKSLIENGAKLNVAIESSGDTPLHIAIKKKNHQMIKFLVDQNCDPQRKNKKKQSAFDLAQGNDSISDILREACSNKHTATTILDMPIKSQTGEHNTASFHEIVNTFEKDKGQKDNRDFKGENPSRKQKNQRNNHQEGQNKQQNHPDRKFKNEESDVYSESQKSQGTQYDLDSEPKTQTPNQNKKRGSMNSQKSEKYQNSTNYSSESSQGNTSFQSYNQNQKQNNYGPQGRGNNNQYSQNQNQQNQNQGQGQGQNQNYNQQYNNNGGKKKGKNNNNAPRNQQQNYQQNQGNNSQNMGNSQMNQSRQNDYYNSDKGGNNPNQGQNPRRNRQNDPNHPHQQRFINTTIANTLGINFRNPDNNHEEKIQQQQQNIYGYQFHNQAQAPYYIPMYHQFAGMNPMTNPMNQMPNPMNQIVGPQMNQANFVQLVQSPYQPQMMGKNSFQHGGQMNSGFVMDPNNNQVKLNLKDQTQIEQLRHTANVLSLEKVYKDKKKELENLEQEKNEIQKWYDSYKANENKLKETLKEREEKLQELKKKNEELEAKLRSQLPSGSNFDREDKSMMTDSNAKSALLADFQLDAMEKLLEDPKPDAQFLTPDTVATILHHEILSFEESVNKFNTKNKQTFDNLIHKLSQAVEEIVPDAKCTIYGSFATGLCLPWSDIDIVIELSQPTLHHVILNILDNIEASLKKRNWVEDTKNIRNTSVPVLKITCSKLFANKKVDLSIQDPRHNGLACVDLVKEYLTVYPPLRPLALALKQFLFTLNLNDTYSGGLSSYGLILMIIYMFQTKETARATSPIESNHLGNLLISFLYIYGMEFDYVQMCSVFPKKIPKNKDKIGNINLSGDEYMQMMNLIGQNPPTPLEPKIFIHDPLSANNNVGRSTFHIKEIKVYTSRQNKVQSSFIAAYMEAFQPCLCEIHKHIMDGVDSKKTKCSSIFKRMLFAYPSKQALRL